MVGVLVPDSTGVDDPVLFSEGAGGLAIVAVILSEVSGSWLLRGEGVRRFNAADSSKCSSLTVLAKSSCLPALISLEPAGSVVDAERNSRMFATVCSGLTFNLMPRRGQSVRSSN